jgi:hypothetical protein
VSKVNDLTGKTVAGVIVLGKARSTGGEKGVAAVWMCLCGCGATFLRDARGLKDTANTGSVANCGKCPDTWAAKQRGGFGGAQARILGAQDAPLLESLRTGPCHWCGRVPAPQGKDAGNRITKLDWTRDWAPSNTTAECGGCQRIRGFRQAHEFLAQVALIAGRHCKEEDW